MMKAADSFIKGKKRPQQTFRPIGITNKRVVDSRKSIKQKTGRRGQH